MLVLHQFRWNSGLVHVFRKSSDLPAHFSRYKRSSDRLREKPLKIALLRGGNAGHKLCKTLNIAVSSSTLIRLIQEQQLQPSVPEALGIDDWAF